MYSKRYILDGSLLWDIVIVVGGRVKEVDRALLMTEKEFYLVVDCMSCSVNRFVQPVPLKYVRMHILVTVTT